MIIKMTKYTFFLLKQEQKDFLEKLQGLGLVDITRSIKPIDEYSEKLLVESHGLQQLISELSQPEPTSDKLRSLQGELAEALKGQKARLVWGEYDPAVLEDLQSKGITVRFYNVAAKSFKPEWKEIVPLEVISSDKTGVWFVTVSDDPSYSFPVQPIQTPSESLESIQKRIEAISADIDTEKKRLEELKTFISEYDARYNDTVAKLDIYLAGAASQDAAEGHVSIITGFAPTEKDALLKEHLDNMDVFYMAEEAKVEDTPPIELKNNSYVKNFEMLTDMYGRPNYDEFDPTGFISIFFLLFFGFCMGDLGYGLVLVAASFAMRKSMKDMAPLVMYLGLATCGIGIFFHTFFSVDMLEWGWIPDGVKSFMLPSKIAGYDGTMVLAIIVGIAHLCIAKVVNSIYVTKRTSFKESLGTWGWTLLIVGGTVVGGLCLIGALDAVLTKWIVIAIGVISAIGIFPLNDIHRSVFANIGMGIYETYNTATGILSDVLSYLRLYALGLAGMYLGAAFNSMGGMILGDEPAAYLYVPFVIVVIIGHTLNIAMAALGAFVHPLRLNFLEFFKNSGYQGTGRNYNPLINNNNK